MRRGRGEPAADVSRNTPDRGTLRADPRQRAARHTAPDELVADDYVEPEQVPGLVPDKAGVRQLFEMFHSAFAEAGVEVDDMVAEGDKVSSWRG